MASFATRMTKLHAVRGASSPSSHHGRCHARGPLTPVTRPGTSRLLRGHVGGGRARPLRLHAHPRSVGKGVWGPHLRRPRTSVATQAMARTQEVEATDGEVTVTDLFEVEDARSLYVVALQKPLGIQLEERGDAVVVGEVKEGGNAAASGAVREGDVVRAVTARVVDSPAGAKPQGVAKGMINRTKQGLFGEYVLMRTAGESFETVIAAIQSNRCSECAITLVLDRADS